MCSSTQLVKPNWRICIDCFPLVKRAPLLSPSDTPFVSSPPAQNSNQGHPMDLFPKISVLQAKFSWLGNLEKLICPWKESVAGQYTIQGVRGDLLYTIACIFYFLSLLPPLKGWMSPLGHTQLPMPPPPPIEGLNFALWPHPNWAVMSSNAWTYVRLQVLGALCWLGTLPSVLLGVRNR